MRIAYKEINGKERNLISVCSKASHNSAFRCNNVRVLFTSPKECNLEFT